MPPINDKKYIIKEIRKNFKGYWKRIFTRIVAICIVVQLTIVMYTSIAISIKDSMDDKNKVNAIRSCETYYYRGDYIELLDILYLYEAYDARFDKYWEIAKARENFSLYLLWHTASLNYDNPDKYKEKADFYAKQVLIAYEKCQDEENKLIMNEFVKFID